MNPGFRRVVRELRKQTEASPKKFHTGMRVRVVRRLKIHDTAGRPTGETVEKDECGKLMSVNGIDAGGKWQVKMDSGRWWGLPERWLVKE